MVVGVDIAAGLGLLAQAAQLLGIDKGGRVPLKVAEAGYIATAHPGQQEGEGGQQAQGHQCGAGVFRAKAKQPSASSRYNQYIVGLPG